MTNTYLVIFSAHVDSEIKKNETIETLKHLKESNIDVCLSTHSGLYLDELSQYVKYVVYDDNNEFLILQDYIDNYSYIENPLEFGMSERKIYHSFGKVSIRAGISLHSKSALILIRNGVMISELNNYKWTIYLEYDVKIPELGFPHFFDYHINRLVESDKKCFYYENGLESFCSMWTGPFIFENKSIFNHEKFIKTDWYSSTKNWIKEWKLGFFESIMQNVINESFDKDEIITEVLQEKYKNYWNVDSFYQIGKFSLKDDSPRACNYLQNSFEVHLLPNVDIEGNRKLFLYYYNHGDKKINLNKILVYSDNTIHIDEKNKIVNPYSWFYTPIDIKNLTNNDTVMLSWKGSIDNENYTTTKSIKISDLEDVHKNIMNITFN